MHVYIDLYICSVWCKAGVKITYKVLSLMWMKLLLALLGPGLSLIQVLLIYIHTYIRRKEGEWDVQPVIKSNAIPPPIQYD